MSELIRETFESDPMMYRSQHEELVDLYMNYRESEIYYEIVLFLNDFNPQWRTSDELGYGAAEFCVWMIGLYDEDRKRPWVERIADLYGNIAEEYDRIKSFYQQARSNKLLNDFQWHFKDVLRNANLDETKPEWEKLYDELYKKEYASYLESEAILRGNEFIWVYF